MVPVYQSRPRVPSGLLRIPNTTFRASFPPRRGGTGPLVEKEGRRPVVSPMLLGPRDANFMAQRPLRHRFEPVSDDSQIQLRQERFLIVVSMEAFTEKIIELDNN